jgi:putative ABC transport system ATP-binding protein
MDQEATVNTKQSAMLSVTDVSKIYKMGEVDVYALRETSLSINAGEFLIIVGPSGSGKSTLLNILGGMDRPSQGKVAFRDQDLTTASDWELTLYRRREIGFVFQFFNLVPSLTARENIEVVTEIAKDAMTPIAALELVGLGDRADHFPAQLSGGQQQRVAIARALAKNPRLILCDEPTGALDTETSRQVMQLLFNLNRELGKTVVLITHDATLSQIGQRVATILDGQIAKVQVNQSPVAPVDLKWR